MEQRTKTMSETNSKQPIDPRKLAANAKVVIQPAPSEKQIKMPARVQGLATMPKPTDNPPPKPEQTQGKQPTPPLPDTHPAKSPLPDTHQAPQSTEVLKKDVTIPQGQKETEKTEPVKSNLGELLVTGGPGRPKKLHSVDAYLELEAQKPHARLPDGTVLTKAQYMAKTMMDKALEGNAKMLEIVNNRLDGKAMQKIQVVAPEDAEGTVISKEAEEKLEQLFGRK